MPAVGTPACRRRCTKSLSSSRAASTRCARASSCPSSATRKAPSGVRVRRRDWASLEKADSTTCGFKILSWASELGAGSASPGAQAPRAMSRQMLRTTCRSTSSRSLMVQDTTPHRSLPRTKAGYVQRCPNRTLLPPGEARFTGSRPGDAAPISFSATWRDCSGRRSTDATLRPQRPSRGRRVGSPLR